MLSLLLGLTLAFGEEPKVEVELSDTVSGRKVRSIDMHKHNWFNMKMP